MTVVAALTTSRASSATILPAEVSVAATPNRELRQRTRILLPFRPRKSGTYQLSMNRTVFNLRFTRLTVCCHRRGVLDLMFRFALVDVDRIRLPSGALGKWGFRRFGDVFV